MKRWILSIAVSLVLAAPLHAEDVTVDLRYEPSANTEPAQSLFATVKLLRPVRISSFTDKRTGDDTYLGELKVNGQSKKVLSKTALSIYAADVFRKVYGEWGGKSSSEDLLLLKGEITQFKIEDGDGYQARIGLHFFLHDGSGKILWDGHSSGIARGTGRTVTPEGLSVIFSDILRTTYAEMLEDEKLVGVWSGNVSNTYVVRDGAASAVVQSGSR